jgi:AcrR family transcriptional regulator
MATAASEATRRTQAERRAHTQRLLLDATLASLAELGYSGTTTLEVERRAGVSRGARIHHYPSKAALLAGAIDKLYEQLSENYAQAFAAKAKHRGSDRQRLRAGLHLLWSIYQRPEFTAVLALNIEARNDRELTQSLRTVAAHHRGLALLAAQRFFPALGKTRSELCIETIHAAFMGLRLQEGVTADARHVELVLIALEDLVMSHLETRS